MANELRVRSGFLGGLVEDNPLSSGATLLTSASLAAMPAIGSTQHMAIILDPDGTAGAPEIAYVTAHVAAATTATITKGQEGSVARAHDRDTAWVHGPTIKDYDAAGGGVGLIGLTSYNPTTSVGASTTATATGGADVDATNLVVAFTGPPSGKVLVRLTAFGYMSTGNSVSYIWCLRDSVGKVTDSDGRVAMYFSASVLAPYRLSHAVSITGLTPGTAYSWKWGHYVTGGTGNIGYGKSSIDGPAVMEVWAVNV